MRGSPCEPVSYTHLASGPQAVQATDSVTWTVHNDVTWISSAKSPTATVPSTITLTINQPALSLINQAHVAVNGMLDGASYPRVANITIVCTDHPIYLPFVSNNSWIN